MRPHEGGGFALASDLDLALWHNLGRRNGPPRPQETGASRPHPVRDAGPDRPERVAAGLAANREARLLRRFEQARLTPSEIADARLFIEHKGCEIDEAIGIIVRSRREARSTTEPA